MAPTQYYTLTTSGKTLTVFLEDMAFGYAVDSQTHKITMDPHRSVAVLEVIDGVGTVSSHEVPLLPDTVVCVDFLPKLFGSLKVMYALSTDRVAVLMHPFDARIDPRHRPAVVLEGGVFESFAGRPCQVDDFPAEPDDAGAGSSGRFGTHVIFEAIGKLFSTDMSIRWASELVLQLA